MKKWRKWLAFLVSVTFFVGCGGIAVSNVDSSKKNIN
jgi:ABC-type glycerol-3-phosphate transport system substrate-binding protein